MERRPPGLEPDEQLLARAPVSFRGAARGEHPVDGRDRRGAACGSARTTSGVSTPSRSGFTTAGPEMVLGVTEARIVVWSTTFFSAGPARSRATLPLANVADVATTRHGAVTGLAVALTSGQILEVEAMRGRRLRRLARSLEAVITTGPAGSAG